MKSVILIITLFFVTGCATTQTCEPIVRIKEVPKLIYKEPPAAIEVPRPDLPVDALQVGDDADKVAKAYVASIELLKDYANKLEITIEPYKKKTENGDN